MSLDHTFDFIDAQFEGPAAPGIAGVFPGPYFVWHEQHTPQSVDSVHRYLESVIDEDGPYDGIIGFSEGAALAASYLLSKEYRATLGDVDECPENGIKLAVFFNSIKPYSPSEEIGRDSTKEFQRELRRHSLFLKGQNAERRGSSVSQEQMGALAERRQSIISQRRESINEWKQSGMPGRKASTSSSHSGVLDEKVQSQVWNSLFSPVFCFDPDSFPCKIQVPTLHIIGAMDQFKDYSKELTTLCDPEQMEVAILDIGHDISRSGEGLEITVEAFELILMMASVCSG
jgi:hypothetical protein